TNSAGGSWTTASNWSGSVVPGSNDDVVIPGLGAAGANLTITLNGNSPTIKSLSVAENLVITGSSNLTVTATTGVSIGGSITLGDSSTSGLLTLFNTLTVSGPGTIIFGASTFNQISCSGANATVTLASNLTIHGKSGTLGSTVASSKLIN